MLLIKPDVIARSAATKQSRESPLRLCWLVATGLLIASTGALAQSYPSRPIRLIVAVAPGKGAIGTYSPPLDPAGNSVRGQRATAYLSRTLGLNLFASSPHVPETTARPTGRKDPTS